MLSRRTLLTSAATTLLWPAWLRAQARELPRFSFLVVTDTHLGRPGAPNPTRQWELTARELDAADGDFVLHLGDVVDGGREAAYGVYREIRRTIRKPVHEVPGNHDRPALFERHLRRPIDTAVDHGGVRFLLFNNSRPDEHDGFITPAQLTWLADQCDDATRQNLFVILAAHVPAHANRHPDVGWYVHPRAGQPGLYELLTRHRSRVLALLHGHFHCGLRGWDDHAPLQEIVFPSALYNNDRRLTAPGVPGYALAEHRPGFVRATLDRDGLTLRYKPVGVDRTTERVCPLRQLEA